MLDVFDNINIILWTLQTINDDNFEMKWIEWWLEKNIRNINVLWHTLNTIQVCACVCFVCVSKCECVKSPDTIHNYQIFEKVWFQSMISDFETNRGPLRDVSHFPLSFTAIQIVWNRIFIWHIIVYWIMFQFNHILTDHTHFWAVFSFINFYCMIGSFIKI